MYTELKDRNIYENANVNFVFDFFSPYKRRKLASLMSKALLRKVSFSNKYDLFSRTMENKTKLYPNFMGGYRMHTLESGFIPYNEAINILLRSLSFIEGNGFTTDKCRMKMYINFNSKGTDINEAQMLNKIKFSLRINESKYFDIWYRDNFERPRRNFMSYVYPTQIFERVINENNIINLPLSEFNYPDSQYFGIDYNNLSKGYVGLKYPGGRNYHKRKNEILDLMNNGIKIFHTVLSEGGSYNDNDMIKFRKVISEQKQLVNSIKTYEGFKLGHKNILLTYDLDDNPTKVKFKYNEFRQVLFELLAYGDVVRGEVNYDSARNKMQVQNTVVRNGIGIHGLEFFNSNLDGDFTNCSFFGCSIKRSRIFDSAFLHENNIVNSIMRNANYLDDSTEMNNTYIDNDSEFIIDGKLINCIVRNGTVSFNASIDKETEIINIDA